MLLILSFCLLIFADTNPEMLGPNFVEGVKALEKKDYTPAQQIFNQLLEQNPQNTTLLFNAGLAEFHLDKVGRALGLWRKARALGDHSTDLASAISLAEGTLNLQPPGDQTFRWVFDFLGQAPHWLEMLIALLLFIYLGWRISHYLGRRRLSFLAWPVYLQVLSTLGFALLSLVSFQIYQGSILRGTITERDLVTVTSPSENSPSLSTLREGEWVFLEDQEPGWWRVRSQTGSVGWVRESALIPYGGYN